MGYPSLKLEEWYTYGDYLTWGDGERWELIDGMAYNMSPAPTRRHQKMLGALFGQFYHYLKDKPCDVYFAPFDVRLPEGGEADEETATVVQPDLVVVCDPDKLDDKGCRGAPDLVVEILSSSTSGKDLKQKFNLYEQRGVREYWIVDPSGGTIMVFRLGTDRRYGRPEVYTAEDTAPVGIFDDLVIDLRTVFAA